MKYINLIRNLYSVELETYGKKVRVSKLWLKKEIYPQTLRDFLNNYTYDDTEYLLKERLNHHETKEG